MVNIIGKAIDVTENKKDLKNIKATLIMKDDVPMIFIEAAAIRKVYEKLLQYYNESNSKVFNLVKEYNYSIFEDPSDLGYLEFLLKLNTNKNKEAISFVSFYESINLIQTITLLDKIQLDYDKIIAYFDGLINLQKEYKLNYNDTEFILEEFKKEIKKGI